jgi:spore germination protein
MNNVPSLSQPPHQVKALKRWKRLIASFALILSLIAVSLWWMIDLPLASPLAEVPVFRFLTGEETASSEGKVVYGFLPYWQLNEVQLQPELTHLSYFGLTLAPDGTIVTRTSDGTEPGYARLQSETFLDLNQALESEDELEVVLAQFNNDAVVQLVSSPQAHQKTLESIDALLLAYPVHGINIDIEYTGEVTPQLRDNLTQFVTTIRHHLNQKYSGVQLSIDVYVSAASQSYIWDVEKLGQQVDYMVVMAYDFHRRSSSQAGPVAPLFGGKDYWDSDINLYLRDFVKKVPPEKILLGVPFYGYEWQTTNEDAQAMTFPDTGSTADFKRVQTLLLQKDALQVKEHWNETALSPYLTYKENELTYVVYFENSRSLSYKLDYVNQLNLGGIAIWALGYEGDSRELWDVVNRKL